MGDHGLVLGVAQPQPDGNLGAVGADGQRHDAAVLGEEHAVDHHRRHRQLAQIPDISSSSALAVAGLKRRDTDERDVRGGLGLNRGAHRLGHCPVARGGHPGQHAFQDHLGEQVLTRFRTKSRSRSATMRTRRAWSAKRRAAPP